MEPMTLGSPSGSPATNPSPYLPSFLMGDQQPTTPHNTLSPNKVGGGVRNLSFATSPGPTSPQDYNRSALGQKTLFGGYQQTPTTPTAVNYAAGAQGMQSHNASLSGPPTQGLFDSLRSERNQVQTPTRGNPNCMQPQQTLYGTPIQAAHNMSATYGLNQSYQQQQQLPQHQTPQYNDSHISNASYNLSRAMVSPLAANPCTPNGNVSQMHNMPQYPSTSRYTDFWVTIYGFPPSATSTILQHFGQCGTIVDKVFPPQNGNWVHLKFASRLECDKALNYNEKILGNNIMIGVTQCKDKSIIDKENLCENNTQTSKVRPLAQTAYKSVQNDSAVMASPNAPQKSSGLMNKAMDLFFGW